MRRTPLVALLLPWLATCGRSPAVDSHSVVLVTLDTTRADALSAFGGTRGVAPVLDALAAESVQFSNAHTVAPLTLPAHASMLTGLYPPRHGVRGNGPARLTAEAETLAERAARAGFQTAAFVGSLALDRDYGISQGYAAWGQPEADDGRVVGQISDRTAQDVLLEARAWLAQRDHRRPFFLWVHLFDPHAPYAAAPEFMARAGDHPYFAEVASMDSELGIFVEELRADGFLEQGHLLVVGDHGEGLDEHGEDTHGQHVWESTLRVPMFLRFPGAQRAGEVRPEFTSVVDVAPTLAGAMGLAPLLGIDGVSLAGELSPVRGTYFEALAGWVRFRWSPMCGWIGPEGKYVHSSQPRLWSLVGDEQRDASSAHPATVERAKRAIRLVLDAPALHHGNHIASAGAGAAIEALGYSSGGEFEPDYPDLLAPSDLPSPDARIDEYRHFSAAQALAATGRHAEAAERLEALLRENPQSVSALDELARSLLALGRWQRAAEVLLERRKHRPERLATEQGLVQCYAELGDAPRAKEHTLHALEMLVEIHAQRGEPGEAARYRELLEQGRADR
jgi:hypothetical protein